MDATQTIPPIQATAGLLRFDRMVRAKSRSLCAPCHTPMQPSVHARRQSREMASGAYGVVF